MGNKISVIIPHYPFDEDINRTLKKCVGSLSGYHELIVVVNSGTGFAKAVNQGLSLATGDYLMVVNNDIEWKRGTLIELCDPQAVTSPTVNKQSQPFWGCFFVIPRHVYETVGGLDEQFGIGYFEDDDYMIRLRAANVEMRCVPKCDIATEGAKTMARFDRAAIMEENRDKFNRKWNI